MYLQEDSEIEPRLKDVAYSELVLPRDASGTESFRAWRDTLELLYEVDFLEPDAREMEGEQHAWHLGLLILGRTRSAQPQRLIGDTERTRNTTGEYYLVQLCLGAGADGIVGQRPYQLNRGDISIIDLGQPSETLEQGIDTLDLLMPRALMEARVNRLAELGSMVLPEGSLENRILGAHMRQLHDSVNEMTLSQARPMAEGTLNLFAAMLGPQTRKLPGFTAPASEALRNEVERYIGERLGNSELGSDEVCRRFNISRTFLYNLFQREGGVTAFIRKRRLERARQALIDPANDDIRIIDIAVRWGFNNESHFSRLFRQAFGISPREARRTRIRPAPRGTSDDTALLPDLEAWFRHL